MDLSMDILSAELKPILDEVHIRNDTDMDLKGVRFLSDNRLKCDVHILYVGTQMPEKMPNGGNLLYFGETPVPLPERYNLMIIHDRNQMGVVFNRILNIFQKYNDWESELSRLLKEHAPLEDFLELSEPIFHAGLCVLDWNHNTVAATKTKMTNSPLWDAIQDGYGYKYRFMIEQSFPKLRDLSQMKTMSQNWSNLDNRYLYNYPLMINGHQKFGIGMHKIVDPTVKFGKDVTQLYLKLGEYITQRLVEDEFSNQKRQDLCELFIQDTISGQNKDPDKVNEQNHYILVGENEYLSVGVVSINNVDFRSSFLTGFARELQSLWAGSICCVVNSSLVWLINLKEYADVQQLPAISYGRIERWLIGKQAFCGFSAGFHSLRDLERRYCEAEKVLQYGLILNRQDGQCLYSYYDHLDYHLAEAAAKTLDISEMLHPALRTLRDFDANHMTNYYGTLRLYLIQENGNTQNEIAAKMHIHRNTLLYRINKIQEIAGVDLDDANLKRQMYVSVLCTSQFQDLLQLVDQHAGGKDGAAATKEQGS